MKNTLYRTLAAILFAAIVAAIGRMFKKTDSPTIAPWLSKTLLVSAIASMRTATTRRVLLFRAIWPLLMTDYLQVALT
jgi:hypothetical protein